MVDALLEPLLKLNNVNNNLTMEKSFLDLRLFYVWKGFTYMPAAFFSVTEVDSLGA